MKIDFSIGIMGYLVVVVCDVNGLEDIMHCENNVDGNCTSTIIINRNIACQVNVCDNGSIPPPGQEEEEGDANLFTPNKRVRGATRTIKCGKVLKGYHEVIQKKGGDCMRELCKSPITEKARVGQVRHLLYKRENFTCTENKMKLPFPFTLKPGMGASVSGERKPNLSYSLLSFFMDPEHKTNVLTWLNIHVHWTRKDVWIAEGFSKSFFKEFPISTSTNFSLGLELTPNDTKIYADRTLVKTRGLISGIDECYIHGFRSVHRLQVHKTDE